MVASIIERLAKEIAVILQAPISLAIAAILIATLVWFALRWQFKGQIENLNSRLSLRDDELAAANKRLSGEKSKGSDGIEVTFANVSHELPRRHDKIEIIYTALAGLRHEGVQLRNSARQNKTMSEKAAKIWRADADRWMIKVAEKLHELSPVKAEWFRVLDTFTFCPALMHRHQQILSLLANLLFTTIGWLNSASYLMNTPPKLASNL